MITLTLLNTAGTGIITATPEELEAQCLGMTFKNYDTVKIRKDPDERFIQISKNGLTWYSIHFNQICINE